MIDGSRSRPRSTIASRVARTAASATTSIARAGEFGARDRALGHAREDALEPVVAGVVQWSALVAANRMRSMRGRNSALNQRRAGRCGSSEDAASAASRSRTAPARH